MTHALEKLGLDAVWRAVALDAGLADAPLARVVSEQRGLYLVRDGSGEAWASIAGRLRHAIARLHRPDAGDAGAERPAVGDFVALRASDEAPDEGAQRVIEHVLPRRACIVRKAAGKASLPQVIAANVDTAFIVCGLSRLNDREVNARRIERLAAMAWDGGATPVILLNKADAHDDVPAMIERAQAAAPGVAVHAISAKTGQGLPAVAPYLEAGKTVVLIGSSGAGKSTLANRWLGVELLATAEVGADGRGRHTSRARQLLIAASGVLVIDTPGVREAGLWSGEEAAEGGGVERAFEEITALASECRFSDCSHAREPGCAVRAAIEAGKLEPARLESFQRLQREQAAPRQRAHHKGRR